MAEFKKLLEENYGILCVGNISERKNQKMLVDAFNVLNNDIRQSAVLILIGGNSEALEQYAKEQNIERVYFTGTIPKAKVFEYMEMAKLLVMASRDEGFGLPIVEAYSYGVPVVMPDSVDAFPDVYCEDTCVPVPEYTPKAFADAIERAYNKSWDVEKITAFAENFSMKSCSEQYLTVLRVAADNKKSPLTVEQLKNAIASCK